MCSILIALKQQTEAKKMLNKSFNEFYEDNEIELEDLARQQNRLIDDIAQELYQDYLTSCYDLEY